MSRETMEWLNRNVLRGFTDKRGNAWHYSAALQGNESNHYPGAIPADDLYRRLFGWTATPRIVLYAASDPNHVEMMDMETVNADGATVTVQVPDPSVPLGFRRASAHMGWARSDSDDLLGIHGDGYNGHQYAEWLVKNVLTMVGDETQIANAGLLKNGAIAWVQIETPDNVTGDAGVTIRPFILATTSFDGSIATTYKDGYTDTVCDNTREMFLAEKGNVYRVKHTRNSAFSVVDARTALNLATDAALAEIHALIDVEVSDAQWSAFVQAHAPITEDSSQRSITMAENMRGELTRLWNTDTRVHPWAGTAWGVVQAVNTYNAHLSIVRNVSTRFERNMMNAVQGKIGKADRATVMTLESVIGRPILATSAA